MTRRLLLIVLALILGACTEDDPRIERQPPEPYSEQARAPGDATVGFTVA